MEKSIRFDKDMTNIVKGFAILFMLILHCYDDYKYEVPLNYDHAFWFAHDGFNICVGIFAFMIGFGYAFSRTKDLKYGWQHIKKLYIPYILIFLLFILPTCYKEYFASGWKMMLYTLLGFDVRYFFYNWFIYVFIYAMVVMPLFSRLIDKNPLRNSLIAVVALYVMQLIAHNLIYPFFESHDLKMYNYIIYNCLSLSPLIVLGYLFAHEHYYERIRVDNLSKSLVLVSSVLTIVTLLYVDSKFRLAYGFLFEFFYVPLLVGAIALLFSKFDFKCLKPIMIKLGWASMYMWFLQALFHTPIVRTVYQPIVTIFNDINIVVVWTMVVLFFAAWLLRSIVDYVLNILNIKL